MTSKRVAVIGSGFGGLALAVRLQSAGHDFREPPPEPTSCCGRGCNGCVWESYDAALMFWYEDAGALMAAR